MKEKRQKRQRYRHLPKHSSTIRETRMKVVGETKNGGGIGACVMAATTPTNKAYNHLQHALFLKIPCSPISENSKEQCKSNVTGEGESTLSELALNQTNSGYLERQEAVTSAHTSMQKIK